MTTDNTPGTRTTVPDDIPRTAEQLRAVLAELADVVASIRPEQEQHPTPCTDYDVAQLRAHVLGWLTTFAAGYADPEGRSPRADLGGYQAPADAAGVIRQAADQLDNALRTGAAQRPLHLGDSAMPGDLALGMILWEYLVHGWDLAVASGQPWRPPAGAAQASLRFAPAMLTDDYQGEGKPFGLPVPPPADASALDRLVALSGRDPRWRTGADHRRRAART